jgi:hypothetical protein
MWHTLLDVLSASTLTIGRMAALALIVAGIVLARLTS